MTDAIRDAWLAERLNRKMVERQREFLRGVVCGARIAALEEAAQIITRWFGDKEWNMGYEPLKDLRALADTPRAEEDPRAADPPSAFTRDYAAGVRAAAEVARRRGPGVLGGWVAGEILKLIGGDDGAETKGC